MQLKPCNRQLFATQEVSEVKYNEQLNKLMRESESSVYFLKNLIIKVPENKLYLMGSVSSTFGKNRDKKRKNAQ